MLSGAYELNFISPQILFWTFHHVGGCCFDLRDFSYCSDKMCWLKSQLRAHTKHICEQIQLARHIFCSLLDQLVMLENNREIDYWSWLSIPGEIMINNLPSAPGPLITDIIEMTLHTTPPPPLHHTWQNIFAPADCGGGRTGWLITSHLPHCCLIPVSWSQRSALPSPAQTRPGLIMVPSTWYGDQARTRPGHTGTNTWYRVFSTREVTTYQPIRQ